MYFVERFCKKGENDLENTIYLTLMNKDRPVMNLSGKIKEDLKRIKLPVFVADKAEIIEENKKFLPVFIHSAEISTELFNKWFAKRVLSDKRRDFPSKIEWQDEFPHFFSLTDHYWLRYYETEKYSDLNFFDNGYKKRPLTLCAHGADQRSDFRCSLCSKINSLEDGVSQSLML